MWTLYQVGDNGERQAVSIYEDLTTLERYKLNILNKWYTKLSITENPDKQFTVTQREPLKHRNGNSDAFERQEPISLL